MFQKNFFKYLGSLTLLLILVVLLAVTPENVKAASLFESFLDEMNKTLQGGVDGVRNLITPEGNKSVNKVLSLESNIGLAKGGDVSGNGQIDAGDTITFTYIIQNNTDKKYAYATLKTNIQRDSLNFIRNATGVTGIKDDGKTIELPNLRVEPGFAKQITFDATVNYFTEQDTIISTEPELITEDKKSLLKSERKQIQSKRIKKEDIPEKIQMFKQDK